MVKWTKNADGTFNYDYTHFDEWVQLNKDLGIADKIIMYSIYPWHGKLTYRNENNEVVYENLPVGSERYKEVWTHFLKDLIKHLDEKDWLDSAYIGIDERGFDKIAFDTIDSVVGTNGKPLKTATAVDHLNQDAKFELAKRVTDLTVGDFSAESHKTRFKELLAIREEKGLRTTLYSCTEHIPGNFSLSEPVESYWTIVNAGEETKGFLRWAYDAWVENPLEDATHNALEPGDTFLIYPGEKGSSTVRSSVRLEKMAEGVRDMNKIYKMVQEIPALQKDVNAMYAKVQTIAKHANYAGQPRVFY